MPATLIGRLAVEVKPYRRLDAAPVRSSGSQAIALVAIIVDANLKSPQSHGFVFFMSSAMRLPGPSGRCSPRDRWATRVSQ